MTVPTLRPTLGLIGFGAFGRLAARHLARHFVIRAYDPGPAEPMDGVSLGTLAEAASCSVVVLAMPVAALESTIAALAAYLKPGTLVLDVGSVKCLPADIMRAGLPDHAEIVATHPLFGPQSAKNGLAGLKIAVCPVRGSRARRVAAFLRRALGLKVVLTTPEDHDREAAMVQGLTHLIAKVLVRMEPLPARMTTRSFDLIMEAVGMVRHDAPSVFEAIERLNPYAGAVRRQFFALAAELDGELEAPGLSAAAPAAAA